MSSGQTTPEVPKEPKEKTPLGGIFMPWASGIMFIAWIFYIAGIVFFIIASGKEGDEGGFLFSVVGVILMVIGVIITSQAAKHEGLKIAKESEEKQKQELLAKLAYIEQLKTLAKQRDDGTLPQQEFLEKKTQILNIMSPQELEQKERFVMQTEDTPEKREAKEFVLRMYSKEEVTKLAELKDAGILTQEEFEQKKRQVRLEYHRG